MKCFFPLIILIFVACDISFAQSLAINTSGAAANSSSILDVSSTSKGILIPRMTKAQKNSIATPAAGLLVYQSTPDSIGFHYYNGSLWVWLNPSGGASTDWSLTGNAGTDTAVNFIGTTDNMPLAFKVNNEKSGRIESNIFTANTFLGSRSGRFNTGNNNTGFGNRALADSLSGSANSAFGAFALNNNKAGSNNTALGFQALTNNTTAGGNTGVGALSLFANTTGSSNTAMGASVLQSNTIGINNTAIGASALIFNTTGSFNTAIGGGALLANTIGSRNLAIGGSALTSNIGGSDNTAIGFSLINNTFGQFNIAIGSQNLYNNTVGDLNISIGASTLFNNTNRSNLIAIGNGALYNNGIGVSQPFHATNNIAVGTSAMEFNTIGYNNIAIGNNAIKSLANGVSNIALGNNTLANSGAGSSNNTAIGDSALHTTTTGDNNTALGGGTLLKNTSGSSNIATGVQALYKNTTGSRNVANGLLSLYNNTSGNSNIALGFRAAYQNQTGDNNVVIGDSAAYISTNLSHLVAIGSKALYNNLSGISLTAIGDSALYSNINGGQNTAVGSSSMVKNTTGFDNTAIGTQALSKNTTAMGNTAVGSLAMLNNTLGLGNSTLGVYSLYNNIVGSNNTVIGATSMFNNTSGGDNTTIGAYVMDGNTTGARNNSLGVYTLRNRNGSDNIAIGYQSGSKVSTPVTTFANNIFLGNQSGYNSSGDDNVFIGTLAGNGATGNGNIFIGAGVGTGNTFSNLLAIDNTNTATPLIYGSFAADLLRINGTLNINSQYSFPLADGTANQVLYTDGAGNVGWANAVVAANNGLNVSGSIVKLGGTLLDSTTITQGANSLVFNMDGTGDFYVRKNTTEDAFMVKNNGFVGLNTADPQYRMHIINTSGGNGPFGRGIVIENSATGQTGEASIAFKNNGPNSVAINSAWMTGLNNATNFVIAYGDSLKASNVKMKVDTLGNVSIGNQGAAAQSKLDVSGSFGNAIRSITADYTTDGDDHTIIIATSVGATPLTITLPAANTCDRREYTIVNRNASIKTVTSYNDFSGTSTAIPGNGSITLQSNGTNWFRIR